MAKLFMYDLETTGTSSTQNGIHQISGIIKIDGTVREEFNFHVRPKQGAVIDPKALEVAGVTEEQIMSYPDMKSVHPRLVTMMKSFVDPYDRLDKFFLVGYNNRAFDDNFFRNWFFDCGDKFFGSWFWSNSIDVMVLASQYLAERRREMENFKQGTVAKALGIEVKDENLHDALYDIRICDSIYTIVTQSTK